MIYVRVQQRRHRAFPKAISVTGLELKRPPLPPMLHKRSGERVWVEMTSDPTFLSPGSSILIFHHAPAPRLLASREQRGRVRKLRSHREGSDTLTLVDRGRSLAQDREGMICAMDVMVRVRRRLLPFSYADTSKFPTALVGQSSRTSWWIVLVYSRVVRTLIVQRLKSFHQRTGYVWSLERYAVERSSCLDRYIIGAG